MVYEDRSHSCLDVHRSGNLTTIGYLGGMRCTEQTAVKPAFDAIYGTGAFDLVRPHGKFLRDIAGNLHDCPQYSYALQVPNDLFDSLIAGLTAPKAA